MVFPEACTSTARVWDDFGQESGAITDSNGEYSYRTWPDSERARLMESSSFEEDTFSLDSSPVVEILIYLSPP